jgi:glycosyltransferase involved in cell wall biosynthesis
MKLLIAEDKSRASHLDKFCFELEKLGVECKTIGDLEIFENNGIIKKYSKFLSTPNSFKKIMQEFKPDFVLVERVSQFSSLVIKSKIPLLFFLLGDFWSEIDFAKKHCESIQEKIKISMKERMAEKCFRESRMIFPICNYLEKIVNEKYPNKKTAVMYQGIDLSEWKSVKNKNLKHPCVGLLQGATIWGKTQEMLILSEVLKAKPDVMFYWAGNGQYKDKILKKLCKFNNFEWLGTLEYPNEVQEFLTEIDVYALISGQDMSPHTLLEAGLMKKPIIATDIGGVSESMINEKSGYLVRQGDSEEIIYRISQILKDKNKADEMGKEGYQFVKENFSWEKIAEKFILILEKELK